ncbi:MULTISPECIES: hypothetical protein [unclassified Streptomyces]|uniref:hypothetical protein n=1 Tax=unclassified Streptomyces TaxID=2593676 RepID=UPI000DC7D1C3|nr:MULTISPECIES: hypothetical protein [unclassified Streptomyces]AWZ09373.1 hypothetical protein DRB89_38410 [Streptomyces sp. ICC4]AWZ17154.1 hypothetical protein DRB96_39010 [Streptomyces sp. ICC1]
MAGWPQAAARLGADGTAAAGYLRSHPERVPDVQSVAGATANGPSEQGRRQPAVRPPHGTRRGEARAQRAGPRTRRGYALAQGRPPSITLHTVAACPLVSVLVAAVAGIHPALRAAGASPTDALRSA